MRLRAPRLRLPRLRLPRWRRPRWPRQPLSRRWAAALAVLLLTVLWCTRGDAGRRTWPRAEILAAIRQVESSGRDDVPDGDGGKAIGPYQIHFVYWQDALRSEPSLGGDYQHCRRRAYAERVIDAYMQKWAPAAWQAGEAETIARIHNGGPGGAEKQATLGYWRRVRSHLP